MRLNKRDYELINMSQGTLGRLTEILYESPLGTLIEKSGIESGLVDAYTELLYRTSGEKCVRKINDLEASFYTETRAECKHFYGNFLSEKDILSDFLTEINEDDVFYDIGGNVGLYTCFAALKTEKVYVFEPYDKNRSRIYENLDLNELNAEIFDYAISDENSTSKFSTDKRNETGSGMGFLSEEEGDLEVETRTLDSLVEENLPTPHVIKIDVEGAELEVLKGMETLLKNDNLRTIYCEIHPNILGSEKREHIYNLLEENGFEVKSMSDRGEHSFIKASR